MIRSAGSRVRTRLPRRAMLYRPALESLEPRLPPGDAVLGLLLAWPELTLDISEPDHEGGFSFNHPIEGTLAFATTSHRAAETTSEPAADEPTPTSDSPDSRAAGLIPAVRTAGINPAARHTGSFRASESASDSRAAGLIPAVYPGGINPAARTNVQEIGVLASHVPGRPTPTKSANADSPSDTQRSEVMDNYGNLPLTFEANHGQTDARVDFIARTGGATVFLTSTAAVFSIQNSESRIQNSESGMSEPRPLGSGLRSEPLADARGSEKTAASGVALHMQIVGANPNAVPLGQDRLPGIVNYFIGNDPSQWHANIPTFGRVEYQDVYPGINLVYYGNNGQLEYDFIVSPGADPSAITLNFAGADGVEINPHGDLVLHTAAGDVVQQKPLTYQEVGQTRPEVTSRYVLDGTSLRFEVGAYDATRPLVIDPLVMGYSTYLGAPAGFAVLDSGRGIAVDAAGNAYIGGVTESQSFPTTPGAFDTTYNGLTDIFISKLNTAGSGLVYSTYLGGSDNDSTRTMAVGADGSAYLTGSTASMNFPTTQGAFDTVYNGGFDDAFVTKLDAAGTSLVYSTYLGGTFRDIGADIAVDAIGNAYVEGVTNSPDFPTTAGAYSTVLGGNFDCVVVKLHADGSSLLYSTYLGGSFSDEPWSIAVDESGHAYISGIPGIDFPTTPGAFDVSHNGARDGFVAKLSPEGSSLVYSTFLGGSGGDSLIGLATDTRGNAYVTGQTDSTNFPTTPGSFDTTKNGVGFDAFVTKLNADGSGLAYSTYLGGGNTDDGWGIAVDSDGNAYVTGDTASGNFPTTSDAFDKTVNFLQDVFVTKLNRAGSTLVYSTYLGGFYTEYGLAIAVDNSRNVYVTGETQSQDFPTTPGALKRRNRGASDAFVTKFAEV